MRDVRECVKMRMRQDPRDSMFHTRDLTFHRSRSVIIADFSYTVNPFALRVERSCLIIAPISSRGAIMYVTDAARCAQLERCAHYDLMTSKQKKDEREKEREGQEEEKRVLKLY